VILILSLLLYSLLWHVHTRDLYFLLLSWHVPEHFLILIFWVVDVISSPLFNTFIAQQYVYRELNRINQVIFSVTRLCEQTISLVTCAARLKKSEVAISFTCLKYISCSSSVHGVLVLAYWFLLMIRRLPLLQKWLNRHDCGSLLDI